jgi:hypothetical protein
MTIGISIQCNVGLYEVEFLASLCNSKQKYFKTPVVVFQLVLFKYFFKFVLIFINWGGFF